MDFNDSKEQAEFRTKCRGWLEQNAQLKTEAAKDKKEGMVGEEAFLESAKKWQSKNLMLAGQCFIGQKSMEV